MFSKYTLYSADVQLQNRSYFSTLCGWFIWSVWLKQLFPADTRTTTFPCGWFKYSQVVLLMTSLHPQFSRPIMFAVWIYKYTLPSTYLAKCVLKPNTSLTCLKLSKTCLLYIKFRQLMMDFYFITNWYVKWSPFCK